MEVSGVMDNQERELMLNLSQAYLAWERETEQRGIHKGIQTERRATIVSILTIRFGGVDEPLAALIPVLVALPTEDYAQFLLQLPQLSREELLARFHP
jgi:hypothetical protein